MKRYLEFIKESIELSQIDNLVKGLGNVKDKQILLDSDLIIIELREKLDSVDKDYFELYKKKFKSIGYKLYYNNLRNQYFILAIKINSDIYKFIETNLFNLETKINGEFKEYLNKNGEWMFYHRNQPDLKNEFLYINYDRVWSFFISKYKLQYQQIRYITKCLLEKHYNLKVFTTFVPI